ncbi:MAG: Maf family nucleotide pyrophosphatase [Planctomycetota bacterium]
MKPLIILASASPRRSQILSECGIAHKVAPSNAEEIMNAGKGPAHNVLFNARIKAGVVARRFKRGFVIGADTVVLSGRNLIGKPRNRAEAKRLFREFSGKTIRVYTGLCVIDALTQKSACATTVSKVRVKKITPKMAGKFLMVAGPFDKAGGFSIEGPGSFIFDNVRGSFYNVLGLPMMELHRLFGNLGIDLLEYCTAR